MTQFGGVLYHLTPHYFTSHEGSLQNCRDVSIFCFSLGLVPPENTIFFLNNSHYSLNITGYTEIPTNIKSLTSRLVTVLSKAKNIIFNSE